MYCIPLTYIQLKPQCEYKCCYRSGKHYVSLPTTSEVAVCAMHIALCAGACIALVYMCRHVDIVSTYNYVALHGNITW